MIGVFPSMPGLWRPQASADLTDDGESISLSGRELLHARRAFEWLIENFPLLNEGRQVSIPYMPKLRRAAINTERRLSDVRHDSVTSPPELPESSQNQTRVIKIAEVASILGVSERTIYRWIKADPTFALTIIAGDSLRFDEQMVRAYADHPNRGAAAHANPTRGPL
jgi:predicted DNA-binding transcriptional regulator AlpA